MSPTSSPQLSVVVVVPHRFAQIRRTVRHLRRQDAAEQIELVLVAPAQEAVADHEPGELDGFADVRTVAVGPIPNVDRAAARGVLEARADVVAVVEDHAFVEDGWARAIIDAFADGPWVSVGSVLENANPDSSLSWANLLLGYGWWIDPARSGEMHDVPSHNGTYRRSALARLGDRLPDLMVRGGGLHDHLRADGGRMFLAGAARVAHLNPSRIGSMVSLRFNAGRLYGDSRRREAGWSPVRRGLYALASPLIPVVRFRRLHAEHLAGGQPHAHLVRRIAPGLAAALAADAAGQAAGYLAGPGRAPEVLATFEMDRLQHLSASDRRRLAAEEPGQRRPADVELVR